MRKPRGYFQRNQKILFLSKTRKGRGGGSDSFHWQEIKTIRVVRKSTSKSKRKKEKRKRNYVFAQFQQLGKGEQDDFARGLSCSEAQTAVSLCICLYWSTSGRCCLVESSSLSPSYLPLYSCTLFVDCVLCFLLFISFFFVFVFLYFVLFCFCFVSLRFLPLCLLLQDPYFENKSGYSFCFFVVDSISRLKNKQLII